MSLSRIRPLPALMLASLLAAPLAARADALDELRVRLDAMQGDGDITARIEGRTIELLGEEGKQKVRRDRSGSVAVELNRQGLKLSWPMQQLTAARKEQEARATDEKAPAPTLDGLGLIDAHQAATLLDYAPALASQLRGAVLLETRDEPWQGRPARFLRARSEVIPLFDEETRKIIKSAERYISIWLNAAGLPLAVEQYSKAKGSKFLISMSFEEQESRRFAVAHGRLVAAHSDSVQRVSSVGDPQTIKSTRTVTVLNAPTAPTAAEPQSPPAP